MLEIMLVRMKEADNNPSRNEANNVLEYHLKLKMKTKGKREEMKTFTTTAR